MPSSSLGTAVRRAARASATVTTSDAVTSARNYTAAGRSVRTTAYASTTTTGWCST